LQLFSRPLKETQPRDFFFERLLKAARKFELKLSSLLKAGKASPLPELRRLFYLSLFHRRFWSFFLFLLAPRRLTRLNFWPLAHASRVSGTIKL
jgi:hypothetical protein